ncbi:hypothetical protein DL98DRAFT_590748 [Cadophora sp. DSE1049]|nr:hypothetical protein DL98DRAFT_590748 [Cadophora sp. DSE1049]
MKVFKTYSKITLHTAKADRYLIAISLGRLINKGTPTYWIVMLDRSGYVYALLAESVDEDETDMCELTSEDDSDCNSDDHHCLLRRSESHSQGTKRRTCSEYWCCHQIEEQGPGASGRKSSGDENSSQTTSQIRKSHHLNGVNGSKGVGREGARSQNDNGYLHGTNGGRLDREFDAQTVMRSGFRSGDEYEVKDVGTG